MQKKVSRKTGIPPLMIIILLTIVAFLIYFALSSAVQNRFQLLYTASSGAEVYAVSGWSKQTQTLVIPATYRGDPVAYVLDSSFSNTAIRSLTMESVTKIGAMAFRNCTQLTDLRLGKAEVIGDNAFEFCRSLKTVTLPETVRQIGKRAFSFCEALERVYFFSDPEDLGENIFEFCPNVVIYGTPGGNVEAYCSQYELPFQPLESAE